MRHSSHLRVGIVAAAGLAGGVQPLNAANVSFSGAVANLCVLTVSTPGTLGISATGTVLSSEETGGASSILAVVATGTNPTLSFAAPQLTGPGASLSGATKEISYTSPGGSGQSWTAASSSYVANRLLDTVTIRGRATNSAGFVTGAYSLTTTVTCQQ